MKKYLYLYKITNVLNDKIYIGIHTTNDLDDNYMGSGVDLQKYIREFGVEHFTKEILEFYDSIDDLCQAEREMVDETFVKSPKTYNKTIGGFGLAPVGHVSVKDLNNNTLSVLNTDPRYLSGELVSVAKNMVTVKDINNNYYYVSKDDPRYLSGELVHMFKDSVTVKDKNGNMFNVSKDDTRYLSGELVHIWKGKKHSEESKRKVGRASSIHQKGERNSQYGTSWIHNLELKECKKIKKDDLQQWLNNGWIKGRKMKFQ